MEETLQNYKVYIELKEILNHVEPSFKNKLPKNLIQRLDNLNNNEYNFNYDTTKPLNEQKILKQTKELLSGLYLKYCCDEAESTELIKICKENEVTRSKDFEVNWEERKQKASNTESIEETIDKEEKVSEQNSLQIIEETKDSFIKRLINKIKRFLITK